MRFIMKHMSKKMLSVILALMVLLSAVSVAFSAIANAPAEPYVVTNSKPAIAMLSGLKLDLTKISVEFDEDEIIPGDEITWDVTPNGALLFDEAKASLTVFKPGSYVVTATKTAEPEKTRTINLFASEERATQVEIYNYEFSANDLDANGEFKTSTGWKIVRTAGTAKAEYANGSIWFPTNTTAYVVLDPLSEGGKVVSSFSDVSVEAEIYSKNSASRTVGWYGIFSRLTYTDNVVSATPLTQVGTLYRFCSSRSAKTAFKFLINNAAVNQTTSNSQITSNKSDKYKIQLTGKNLAATWAINGATEFSDIGYTLSDEQKAALEDTQNVCGTIGYYSEKNAETGLVSIKVSVGFTEDELDKIAAVCEDHGYYMVNPSKPAIPVTVGKTLNLNAALVEFSNGDVVTGENISWDVSANNSAIFDKDTGTISIFKAGSYEATATYKPEVGEELTQKVYIFASDVDLNEIEIYKHTFSAADIDNNNFTAASEWKLDPKTSYTYSRKLAYLGTSGNNNYNGVTLLVKYSENDPDSLLDLTDGYIYLDPKSDSGKFLSQFADVNIETNVITYVSYGHTDLGYFGTMGRLDLGENEAYDGTDMKVSASFRAPSSAESHKKTALRLNVSGVSKDFAQDFNAITGQSHIQRLEIAGNTVKATYKSVSAATPNEAAFTLTSEQQVALNATAGKGGTVGVYIGNNTRSAVQSIRVTISFTAEEKKAAEALYADSPYHIIGANKPVIPVKTSTKVSFDGLIFEMADGSFLEAKDIYWDNPYGALKFQDNAVYTYSDGFYTVKAKKSAEDTVGQDIYFITPNADGEYQLYEHTFTAEDVDANGAFTPESEWKYTLSGGYSAPKIKFDEIQNGIAALFDSSNDGVDNPWFGDSGSGVLFLDPESESGKLVSKFSDVTLELKIKPTTRFNVDAYTVGPVVRLDLGPNKAWDSNDAQIRAMYRIPRAYNVQLGIDEETGNAINGADNEKNKTEVNIIVTGAGLAEVLKQDFPLIEKQFNKLKLQAVGPTVKTWVDTGSGYVEIANIELTESQLNNINLTVGKSGHTVGYMVESTTRTVLNSAKVTITFSEDEMARFTSTDIPPLYNVMQDFPAIPMTKATKISLDKLLIELPDGNFTTGEKLNWSTDYVGSNFLIDNTSKEIYAYGSGRYDVVLKDGDTKVMEAHIVVADDYGNYKIFEHTFTKEDADAIAEDGSSDMWIASVHMLKTAKDAGLLNVNNITYMASEWQNRVSAMPLNGSLQFDPTKGISVYTNEYNALTLNPDHKEAKIIAKFSDYIIDFTASTRDKDISGKSNWTQRGMVGALGRVDFGADNKLSFTYGTYMPNAAVSYEHNRLTAKVGVVTSFTRINNYENPEEYTWTALNGADKVTIDNEADTIVATTPGIYNIEGTKEGAEKIVISYIVPHEDYLDHMVGGFFGVSENPTLNVLTYKGANGTTNKYTGNNAFSVAITNQTFKYNIPDTYNYRLVLDGNDIAFSVAPNGTANYAQLYSSKETPLTLTQTGYMEASNKKTGTITLMSNGSSRAWFKSVSVSLDMPAMPSGYLISLGECRDEDDRIIYLNVGETLNLPEINFEVGPRYYNGEAISFKKKPAGLNIIDGVSITPAKEGVYNLTAVAGSEEFEIIVAVSAAGSIFDNGNYEFSYENGAISSYNRADLAQPYSEKVVFPAEHADGHVYEVGAALAMGNPGNKQIVELEFEKYIEKIGSGAFLDATKLKVITIPNTIETIGASAFAGAVKLTDVFLPASVSVIEDNAFRNCNNIKVVISNKDAVIGETAFTGAAIIVGYKGSTAEEYATKNGLAFEEISSVNLDKAEKSIKDYEKIVYDRYNKVNETVKFEIHSVESGGSWVYSLVGVSFTDRSAGKFFIPKTVEITNRQGEKETVSVYPGSGMMDSKVDSRAIYALELEEGVTSTGFWAFRNCYNLKYVDLPESLTSIAQQTFLGCSALETIDIPAAVQVIGLYCFDYCTSLKEVNIDPDGMLQVYGTNAVRKTEIPGRVFYQTKVTKFVAPVSVDWVTNTLVNNGNFKEAWIYNKDCNFSIDSDAQQYYFPKNTVIHGVPGSTAEEIVKEDKARGESEDPAERLLFRNLTFVGDIKDFYTEREGVLDENAKFFGSTVKYEEIKENEFKPLENPYYVVSRYEGVGGKVVMPSHITIGGERVPVYAISASFQFEGVPTNGLPKIINLEIEDGIAVIEDEVFSNTPHLKSIKLPNTLTYIGKKAFTSSGITGTLEIPASVHEISNAAFRNCTNLTDIVFYNPNVKLAGGLFDKGIKIHGLLGSTAEEYATKNGHEFIPLENVKLPSADDYEDNGNYKFTVDNDGYITSYEIVDKSKDYSLKIKIPAKVNGKAVKGIKEGTFNSTAIAGSIMAVEIEEGIEEIGANAFKGLLKLSFVNFPESLKIIGESAFESTAVMGDITLPEGLERIDRNAFKALNGISSFKILSRTVVIDPTGLPRTNTNLVIYGYTNSTAELWCQNFKINFQYLDGGPQPESPSDNPNGDQNGDTNGDQNGDTNGDQNGDTNGDQNGDQNNQQPGDQNNQQNGDQNNQQNNDNKKPVQQDQNQSFNEIIRVVRQSNVGIVIIIAVAMLMLSIILAAAVVIVVVIKKKQEMDQQLQ